MSTRVLIVSKDSHYKGTGVGAGFARISKSLFYTLGGFSDPRNVRVSRNGSWAYYREQ